MLTISLTHEQMKDATKLFEVTDKLRKYISDPVIGSVDPDTDEEIKLLFSADPDRITMQIYRRNKWIMAGDYKRNGEITEFKPIGQW